MADFLVRIALTGIAEDDDLYAELDALLLQYDFTRSILGFDGEEYTLPCGTYDGDSTMNAEELRTELAESIENALDARFALLVVQRSAASWTGLRPFGEPAE